jgi:hypothetical protein
MRPALLHDVIPAKAGIQGLAGPSVAGDREVSRTVLWTPAFAAVTRGGIVASAP